MFKYKFILLNNNKNDNIHFSASEIRNDHDINNTSPKLFILLLLIINFYILKLYISVLLKCDDKNFYVDLNDYGSTMSNYSLYELYKYEQITLLINEIYNWEINDKSLLNFIDCLKKQTLKDLQIIFILPNETKPIIYDTIKSNINECKNMEVFTPTENQEFNINYLMNLIKGKFTMIFDKFVKLSEKEIENIYLMTIGKINNIFEFKIQNISFYLIKTKIIRNLIDEGQLFKDYNDLLKNIIILPNPQLNYITIAMCPNDYYVPFTYVSMISILSSKDEFTFVSFYLVISKEFKKENINFLSSLYEQFDYFNITFVEMDDRYKNAFLSRRMTVQTYYRFSLGELFPFMNRILYLDSDIIVYKDLTKLYNLNFNGKIVLGQITGYNKSKQTGIFHINNGILLFNLNQLRKMKIEERVLNIIKKRQKLRYHDQTLMNNYFKQHIGIFPLEYHVRNWGSIKEMKQWNKLAGNIYDIDYFYFAQKYPSIRHFLGKEKPIKTEKNHIEDWWYFARKSKYYIQKSKKFEKIFSFNKNISL